MNNNIRAEILHKAEQCICNDRESQYGLPEDSFQIIANLWNGYLKDDLKKPFTISSKDVAILMALMKIARIKSGVFKEDSFVDCCGYIACGAEAAIRSTSETTNNDL